MGGVRRLMVCAWSAAGLFASGAMAASVVQAQVPQTAPAAGPSSQAVGISSTSPTVPPMGPVGVGAQQLTGNAGQYQRGGQPQRAPGQNCGGLGSCAWSSQTQATASCTA